MNTDYRQEKQEKGQKIFGAVSILGRRGDVMDKNSPSK
jgi:hypothetical protein